MEAKKVIFHCAVGGLVQRNAMCGYIMVSGKQCGYEGQCPHQRTPQSAAPSDSVEVVK